MFWNILGITPTKDKKKITMAYREKLVETNPEDKPEQFKELRDAYEQALAYADNETQEYKSPVEIWEEELKTLYNDFEKRKSVDCWKQLLDKDICKALDSRYKIEQKLLVFIMNAYFIPHAVWVYLEEEFSFLERIDELYENYPKEFIDYIVVNGIKYEDTLPFNLYYPGVDGNECEKYLSLYLKITGSAPEETKALFNEMIKLGEAHPYGDALRLIYEINDDMPEKREQLKNIVEKYNYDHRLALILANQYFADKDYEKCEITCGKGLENHPDDTRIMWLLANCLAAKEKYKEAIDYIHDLMGLAGGDQRQLADLDDKRKKWNEKLIVNYEKIKQDNPDDNDNRVSLAWAYLQNNRYDEADEIAKGIDINKTDPFDYYNLLSNIDFTMDRIEQGIDKIDNLIEVIKQMKPDGTKKTEKRIKRLAEMYSRKGYYLYKTDKVEEGLAAYKQAICINPESTDILTQLAQISIQLKNYNDCIDYSREITKISPNAYHGYLLLALGQFSLNNDSEAFYNVNRAIELYEGDLESYVLKLKILIRNDSFDAAKELIGFLDNNNVGDDLSVLFCKANVMEFSDKNTEGALEIYQRIIKSLEEGGYCPIGDQVYYRCLCLTGEKSDISDENQRKKMIELADKGLKINPNNYGLCDYKAWLLRRDNREQEALEIYLKLAALERHSPDVNYQIGRIYYEDLDEHADQALEYLLKAYEEGEEEALFYISYVYYYMNCVDLSEKYCLLLRESEKKANRLDIDSYYRMSYIYEKRKQYDKALEENEMAIENGRKGNNSVLPYYSHKVRLLRLMNKPVEAEKVIRDVIVGEFGKVEGLETLVELYMQFGMYDKADKLLTKLLADKSYNNKSFAYQKQISLYLMTGKRLKAKFASFDRQIKLPEIYLLDNKTEKYINDALKDLQLARENDDDLCYCLTKVAEAYCLAKDRENMLKYGILALENYEKEKKKYSLHMALDYVSLARIYICLERYEEAKELFEKARSSSCSNCVHARCKDADFFETRMLYELGMDDKANENEEKYASGWLADEDFKLQLEYIKKRNKK